MEYTNRHNLAPEIVRALTKDRYNPDKEDLGDYSVTTLISPIQQTILKRRHKNNLKQIDVIDLFWSFVGSIAHKVLEEHGTDESLIESRFYLDILGKKISGQIDHYKDGIITDYKSTKVYKIMKGDHSEWEKQLNLYAYLATTAGYPVKRLRIFTFLLDWKKNEAMKKGYPVCPIIEIPLRLWSKDEQETFITSRVRELDRAHDLEDHHLPECTPKEMWQDVKDYAVFKKNAKRATKVFDNEYEAELFCTSMNTKDVYVERRMTKRTRCFDHCPAAIHCHQHKRLSQEEGVPLEQESEEGLVF